MSKILVIPDVHGRTFWIEPVEKYINDVERVIFLGDYVDPYQQEGFTRKDAINTLESVIELKKNNPEKVILLLGNHDCQYIDNVFSFRSRMDKSNFFKIRKIYHENIGLFKIAHEEKINDKLYLFSHAGLMPLWYNAYKDIIGEINEYNLNKLIGFRKGVSALNDASHYRTWIGSTHGSIVWSDVRERLDGYEVEFKESPYDYQIFGHTQLTEKPIIEDKFACLDCRRAFFIDTETGLITEVEKEKTTD